MSKIEFRREVKLLLDGKDHYTAQCCTKQEAKFLKSIWMQYDGGKPSVKIIKYTKPKFKRKKLLNETKVYNGDTLIHTLWLVPTVSYYVKVFWCLKSGNKVIDIEYVHTRWPTENFIKKTTITKHNGRVKGI